MARPFQLWLSLMNPAEYWPDGSEDNDGRDISSEREQFFDQLSYPYFEM
jgi:hypothetical protein